MENKLTSFSSSLLIRYALLKLFEPYGKIVLFEYMFHLQGPKKGTPRGYCFLEYEDKKSALTAISNLNNKTIKGRHLSVSFALKNANANDSDPKRSKRSSPFQMLRNQRNKSLASTDAKIQAIEEKLAKLKKPQDTPSRPSPASRRHQPY
ncbi:hypothetical protein DM01DRAFT_1373835 [Hesseltinella vesiculosa]|uniref:RRM domain-containing protein n=1 Tax=Hesseltinella vesiculosa TaxID=101127 RepID=A0A1X2GI34_9FUNG|nr:hypothetical protein DM01DRAFT_1373835 [Hesseltinella vesiculosa]